MLLCFIYPSAHKLLHDHIQSHIDYAISSWFAAMTQKAKTKLQIIQNKMVRFILDLGPRTHITNKHMSDLNILKIPGREEQLRLNIAHKIYYNQAPTYLQTNFHKNNDRGLHTRGSRGNFVVPNVKGTEGKTFCFNAMKDWNNLTLTLKTCENTISYRRRLRRQIGISYSFKSTVSKLEL